jgi:hypothetical protein
LAQRIRHNLAALCAFVAVSCSVSTARASPPGSETAEPFRVVWSTSAGCEDAEGFSSELKSRTALLRSAGRDEHAITFVVETFREPRGVRGQLTVRRPDGELSTREVPGATCEEVESAMALIAVLTVDPLAAGVAAPGPHRKSSSASPAATTERAPEPWSVLAEHRLIAQSAVGPHLAVGEAGRIMLLRRWGAWNPSLSIAGRFAATTATAPAGKADLEWAAGELAVCPLGVQPEVGWDLRACALLQVGRLRGTGFQTPSPASKSILWSAVGAQLEARFAVVGPLWVGAEAAFSLPLTRESFYLDPRESLHAVPAWAVSLGAGVGVRFF